MKSPAGRLRLLSEKTYPSKKYKGLENILLNFLREQRAIAAACFGVAGPVTEEVIIATNLPWWIDIQSLRKVARFEKIEVINDLVANAYGISLLKKSDFEILNVGKPRKGNQALISAGTGLGRGDSLLGRRNNSFPLLLKGDMLNSGPETI